MILILQKFIEREAKKRLHRYQLAVGISLKNRKRFELRTGLASTGTPKSVPFYWSLDAHFSPIYCIKHSRFLAKAILAKIKANQYVPKPALQVNVPKITGGHRPIRIFSIP